METLECIKSRTCIRKYSEKPVSEVDIRQIIEAAVAAPSSGNSQDWDFVVVKSPEKKASITEAALGQNFINKAPFSIVVCSNEDRNKYGERGKYLYSIQNTAAAIQNILLAAWDKGLGTCWVGAFNEQRVKEILGIPGNVRPLAIITIGYPAEKPRKPQRYELDYVVHWDDY